MTGRGIPDQPPVGDGGYLPYGGVAGHVRGSETSKAAADSIRHTLGPLQERVLAFFRLAGPRGLTDIELDLIAEPTTTLRPRRIELTHKGLLRAKGEKRRTPTGRSAEVYVLA